MPWIRLSDNYMEDEKIDALSNGAFRLWHEALAWCRRQLTDGLIPFPVMRRFPAYTKGREKELATPVREGVAPLWELIPATGYKVHNYLKWNKSKEEEEADQELSRHRMAFTRDPQLRQRLRERDGDMCRYCGKAVNWQDRKGASGATYDHIEPRGSMDESNLVIACRGCNSKKRNRTPEQAGMVLLPIPNQIQIKPRSDLRNIKLSTIGEDRREEKSEEYSEYELMERAGRLREELYPQWYAKWRNGARLRLVANSLEYQDALSLVQTWDDARLEKLARIVLTTDEAFISGTDRSFKIFALKASWADDRLRQIESKSA